MKGQVPLIFFFLAKGVEDIKLWNSPYPVLAFPMSSSVNPCVGKLVWIGLATVAPVWAIWPWNTCKLRKGFKSASSWSITSPPCNHIVPILQWECNEKTWSKEWTWFCSLLAMSSCQRSALALGDGDVSVTRQIVLWFLTTSLKVPLPQCDCYLAVA